MRFVRFRKALSVPLIDTATQGPIPGLLTTTSTSFVFKPPSTVNSPPAALSGS